MSVHCTVSNCQWWGQGHHCKAEGILITSDNIAARLEDKWDYPETEKVVQMNGAPPPVPMHIILLQDVRAKEGVVSAYGLGRVPSRPNP